MSETGDVTGALRMVAEIRSPSLLAFDPRAGAWSEIAEAHWLSADELRDPARLDIELPGPTAIARSLVEAWLARRA